LLTGKNNKQQRPDICKRINKSFCINAYSKESEIGDCLFVVKIYWFLVKNTVIFISFAINNIITGHVATFNKVVNPILRNEVCLNGMIAQMFCNNIIFVCFLFKQIYLSGC